MKKYYMSIILVALITLNIFSQDLLPKSKELGFISYLTAVKSITEFKFISLASDDQYKTENEKVKQFLFEYNLIRLSIDKLINQLSADMISKNSLKKYNKINKFIKGKSTELPQKMKPYEELISEIDGIMESLMLKTYSSMAGGPSIDEILGIVELTHGIISDVRDFREKKVSNIVGLLKDTKLNSAKELTEKN